MTIAATGRKTAPQMGESLSDYTNSIITCCWADGQPRKLSKLYTCNPQFDLLCVEKAKNGTQAAKLKAEINLIALKAA